MDNYPNFFVVRFTHGAAGKFVCSVLQTSASIRHWNDTLEQFKKQPNWRKQCLDYVSQSFPKDHTQHLRNEPIQPFNTDLYSTSYDRGNNITLEEYVDNARKKADTALLDCVDKRLYANVTCHKINLPLFMQNSKCLTVLIETESEQKWVEQTLWSKHYLEKDGKILYMPNHPDHCSSKNLDVILKYNNPHTFCASDRDKIYQTQVVENSNKKEYTDKNYFTTVDSKLNLDNKFISLSCVLNKEQFLIEMHTVFEYFELEGFDKDLISQMHSIWLNNQLSVSVA